MELSDGGLAYSESSDKVGLSELLLVSHTKEERGPACVLHLTLTLPFQI